MFKKNIMGLLLAVVLTNGHGWSRDNEGEFLDTQGLHIYGAEGKKWAVYIPPQYSGREAMPLVVSAHGSHGSGPSEIKQWISYSKEIGFVVVSPTFQVSNGSLDFSSDRQMLEEIMAKVFSGLKIDRKHVLFTGFSGGGFAAWYVATAMPHAFTALCFRSANFAGPRFGLDMSPWLDRPIYIYWGEYEAPYATYDNPSALEYLQKTVQAHKVKFEQIDGGGHSSRPDLAADWFRSILRQP